MPRPPPARAAPKRARDPTPVRFGKALKEAREAVGMSQSELARAAGNVIAQPDLPSIERGDRDIRLSTANRLARAVGRELHELLSPVVRTPKG
jgi:transcriptional regulator with XRE-family HTH domain